MDGDENSTGRTGPPLQGVCVKLMDWEEGNYRVTDDPPRGKKARLFAGGLVWSTLLEKYNTFPALIK